MDKDLRKLLQQLEAQGFEWKRQTNGHIGIFRDGQRIETLASTPSDWRSRKNSIARLKRAGFDPKIDRKGRHR